MSDERSTASRIGDPGLRALYKILRGKQRHARTKRLPARIDNDGGSGNEFFE